MAKRKPALKPCGVCGGKACVREAAVAVWSEIRIRPVGRRCTNGCVETFNDPDGSKWNNLMRRAGLGKRYEKFDESWRNRTKISRKRKPR